MYAWRKDPYMIRNKFEYCGIRNFAASKWILLAATITIVFFLPVIANQAHIPYDFQYYHFPLLYENIKGILSGEFPLWGAATYSGFPYIANPQTGIYYPLNYIPLLLNLVGIQVSLYSAQYIVIVHFFLGMVGAYLWFRSLLFCETLAFYGACLYNISGYAISQYQHLGVLEIFALLPFGLILIQTLAERADKKSVILLSVLNAFIILTGFLPTAYMYFVISTAYFLYLGIWMHKSAVWKTVSAYIASIGITFLLCCIQLLPILEYYTTAETLGIQGGFEWQEFLNTFFSWEGANNQTVNFYMGTLAPGFILMGFVSLWKRKRTLLIPCIVGGVTLSVVSFNPTAYQIGQFIEQFGVVGSLWRGNNFAIFFCLLGVTLFVLGVDFGVHILKNKKICKAVYILAIGTLLQLFMVQYRAPLYAFDGASSDYGPNYTDFTQTEVLSVLQSDADVFRVMVEQSVMGGQWSGAYPVWDLEAVNGFDPMISKEYIDFIESNVGQVNGRTVGLELPEADGLKWLNVKYYLTNDNMDPPFENDDFVCIYDDWYNIYEYKGYMDRYQLSNKVPDPNSTSVALELNDLTNCSVDVIAYGKNSRELFANNSKNGALLYIGERNYSGWHAYVNGEEVPIITVNDIFMGVTLPDGKCQIELVFRPLSFVIGSIITSCTMLSMVIGIVMDKFQSKRKSVQN